MFFVMFFIMIMNITHCTCPVRHHNFILKYPAFNVILKIMFYKTLCFI